MSTITIPSHDGKTFDAYIAIPQNVSHETKAHVVIVIQEIFGVNDGVRGKCQWLADNGFIAIAPDLFWRIEQNIELSDQVPEELERAFELFGLFDVEQGLKDIQSTIEAAQNHDASNGNVGCLGYCLGGKMAYLTACHTDVKACVGYYGVGIENMLADANNIKGGLMLHIAEKDGFVPPEAQEKIRSELGTKPNVTLHSYPDMDHAFTREGGDNYDAGNAEMADTHSIAFLQTYLK